MAIQQVQQGDTITAAKTNELVAAANKTLRFFCDPGTTTTDTDSETIVNDAFTWRRRFQGQRYLEPFDLSIERATSSSKVRVLRPHLYLSGDNFYEIPRTSAFSIDLPAQEDISILLSSDASCTLSTFGLCEEDPGGNNKCWCLWTLLSNGVVKEDLRSVALAGPQGETDVSATILDLSSLDWNQTSAQLWHYNGLQQGDTADKAELTANNGWKFPVRPPNGAPHLKYVDLNTMKDVIGGGGTGGKCSCDLSVVPPANLSVLGQDLVKIAAWTKDSWQTQVDILAPDIAPTVNEINLWGDQTPFSLTLTEDSIAQGRIEHCFFYYGRELKTVGGGTFYLTGPGTYYLHIATDQYGHYQSATILRTDTQQIPPPQPDGEATNTDTDTYYALWRVPDVRHTHATGIPFDYRHMYHLPFYSS